jgi:hypothetical protein
VRCISVSSTKAAHKSSGNKAHLASLGSSLLETVELVDPLNIMSVRHTLAETPYILVDDPL